MDQRLVPRRSLGAITLTGARAGVHGALRWLLAALVIADLVAYRVTTHHVVAASSGEEHSVASDVGGALYVAVALVIALQLAGWRRRVATRVLTAGLSAAAMFLLLVLTAFAHILSAVEGDEAAQGLAAAILGLVFVQLVIEITVTVRERRRLEAEDPTLPTASIVSR
jgi:hypothetical protein